MAKRASRRQNRRQSATVNHADAENVRHLFEAGAVWSPTNEPDRAQKYRKNIRAQNDAQQLMLDAIDAVPLVIAVGVAGTGKTYLAVAKAVDALENGRVRRIVLSRPAVEAGESLGYLPGNLEEKMSPYLRPLYDILCDRLSSKRLKALIAEGVIEIAPIGYMRGRTLNNAYIVIDEAQNCTYGQLKMLLTRLGWHSTMVVTGDPEQTDLLPEISGLSQIVQKLDGLENIETVTFGRDHIVRHPLVGHIIDAL